MTEKGNWEKVSWKVKAANNSVFADAYLLDEMRKVVRLEGNDKKYVDNLFRITMDEAVRLITDFSIWKIAVDWLGLKKNKPSAFPEITQEEINNALSGSLYDLTSIVKKELGGMTGGDAVHRYVVLCQRLEALASRKEISTLDDVMSWVHKSGTLFTGSTGKNAPLTQEFVLVLATAPEVQNLLPYASEEVRDFVGLSLGGTRFGKKKGELDLEKLWRRPGK